MHFHPTPSGIFIKHIAVLKVEFARFGNREIVFQMEYRCNHGVFRNIFHVPRKSVDFIRMEILLRIKRLLHFHSERKNLEWITTSYITIEIHEVFPSAYKSRQTVKHGNDSSFAGIPADIRYKVSKTIIPYLLGRYNFNEKQ